MSSVTFPPTSFLLLPFLLPEEEERAGSAAAGSRGSATAVDSDARSRAATGAPSMYTPP